MKKISNKVILSGYLYDHDLQEKVTGPASKNPGSPFITGTISIATDDNLVNIVDVHYSFVSPTNSKGTANTLYTILADIIHGKVKTVMRDGADEAAKLSATSAVDLNEFYSTRSGSEELVSVKRNEGGFLRLVKDLPLTPDDRNLFDVDMLITGVRHVDENPERALPAKTILKGAVFNFRNELLPVEFSVVKENAMDYFEGAEISDKNPMFTHIKGRELTETVTKTIVEEGAFGEDSVREVTSSRKDYIVYWAAKDPYIFDDESTITRDEIKKAMETRNIKLADLKSRLVTIKKPVATAAVDEFDF